MKNNWFKGAALAAGILAAGAAQAETLKIGVAGPFTGPNAAFGAQLQKGAEMAAADLNAAGGVLGMQIELTFGDDVSDPKQGVSVANKFVGEGVKFVLGHFNSGVTLPASEVYRENGMMAVTPSATNLGLAVGVHKRFTATLTRTRPHANGTQRYDRVWH